MTCSFAILRLSFEMMEAKQMRIQFFLFLVTVFVLSACGGGSSVSTAPVEAVHSPFLIAIDPKDHARFDEISKSGIKTRFKEQIEYLSSHGHDLEWYPTNIGQITEHETVQLIYFDYSKYVVGFCSGGFISDNFVVSAGHCNLSVYGLSREGASCEHNLLFAYKSKRDGKMQYYRCDQVMASVYDTSEYSTDEQGKGSSERIHRSDDYTIYRLANAAGNPPLKAPMEASRAWYQKSSGVLKVNDILLGLVVDPPSGNSSFLSKYDVVLSEVIDPRSAAKTENMALYDGVTGKPLFNRYQSGNSGAPVYLLSTKPAINPKTLIPFRGNRIFAAPHSGSWPGNGYHNMSNPWSLLYRLFDIAEHR